MTYSSLIADYLGEGLAANRPATLNIAPTALGLYFAADTGVTSAWNGTGWVTVSAGQALSAVGQGLTITSAGTVALGPLGPGVSINSGTIVAQWQGGTVTALGAGLANTGGTITATGTAGVSSVVVSPSAFLNGGTITSSGTISSPNLAAQSLIGNAGTTAAAAGTIAIGTGLTLAPTGTLSATGAGGSFSAAIFAATNLSSLPTSNPGGGLPWLNNGLLTVGTPQ